MLFKYTAKDSTGKTISGSADMQDEHAVIDNLRKQDLIIISIREEEPKVEAKKIIIFGGNIKPEDLVIFSRELATLVNSGIPLSQSVRVLAEQIENPKFQKVLMSVNDDIETGLSLSEAFSRHPKVFSPLYINMVKAGESSGTLDSILDRLAGYLEKTTALNRKVRAALVYPIVVTAMAFAITTFLVLFVVPTFKNVFAALGGTLPMPTQILIFVSDSLKKYFFFIAGFFVCLYFLLNRFIHTEFGRFHFDRLLINLPLFGPLFKKVAVAKFSRTLSTLVKSGVPILTAIDIVSKTTGNKVIEQAIRESGRSVRDGEPFSAPLERSKLFPPMVIRMISVGEKSGELEKMLSKIADFYEDQVDAAVTGLTAMIEPLVISFLGLVIGFIVLAMFLPILKLTQLVGG